MIDHSPSPPDDVPNITWLGAIGAIILLGVFIAARIGSATGFVGLLIGDGDILATARRGVTVGFLVVGLPISQFLRFQRHRIWGGIGLALILAGGLNLVYELQILLSIPLTYTNWLPLPIIYASLWFWPLLRSRPPSADLLFRRSQIGLILLSVGLGLLQSWSYIYVGALGTWSELWPALIDAAGLALYLTTVVLLPFAIEPNYVTRRPMMTVWLSWGLFMAVGAMPLILRGISTQGQSMANTTLLVGLIVGILVVIDKQTAGPWQWPAVWAFLFITYLLPLALIDQAEAEFMLDLYITPLLLVAVVAIFTTAVLVISLSILRLAGGAGAVRQPLITGTFSLLLCGALFFTIETTQLQPETFFVVMAEQADTSKATNIADRNMRTTAVYEQLTTLADQSQADIRALLDGRGATYTSFYLVNGLEVSGSPWLRRQISRRDDVARVLTSPQTRPLPNITIVDALNDRVGEEISEFGEGGLDPGQVTWGLELIEAPRVWDELGVKGEGIVVGIGDSGTMWTHEALSPNYRGRNGDHNYNWFDPAFQVEAPIDENGHGTHTAGTVLGHNGIGVAPGAEWIACRNLPRNLGNPADYLACMQFFFAPFPLDGNPLIDGDPIRGAHVTNNSWGCPPEEGCDGQTLGIATAHLRHAGQMMVVSAGNDGPSCDTIGVPATNDDVLSVGAVLRAGTIVAFSSRGPAVDFDGDLLIKPDIVAPGDEVLSAWPNGGYTFNSGTSMAGPHVAGVVALMWSAAPDLIGDIEGTEALLATTATREDSSTRCGERTAEQNNIYGYGVINAFAAAKEAQE